MNVSLAAYAAFGVLLVAAASIAWIVGARGGRAKELARLSASRGTAEETASRILADAEREAETLRKGAVVAGKEELIKVREDWEVEARRRREEIDREERRLQEKETGLDRRLDQLEQRDRELGRRASELGRKEKLVEGRQAELDSMVADERQRLEQMAGMSVSEAKAELLKRIEEEVQADANNRMLEIRETARRNADREAKKIVALAVQ